MSKPVSESKETPSDRIWSLVAGLPPHKRAGRQFLLLQAYVDGSGDGTEPILVLSGLIAPVAAWAAFSAEWQSLLDYYDLPYFKMNEAADRWLWRGNIEPIMFFYRILERHVSAEVRCFVPHNEWREAIHTVYRGAPPSNLDSFSYYFSAFQFIQQLAHFRRDLGLGRDERIEIIFDSQMYYDSKVIASWETMLAHSNTVVQDMVSGYPRFLDDKEYLPLQAADLSAWWSRKAWAEKGIDAQPWPYPWEKQRPIPLFRSLYMKDEIVDALCAGHVHKRWPFTSYKGLGRASLFGFPW